MRIDVKLDHATNPKGSFGEIHNQLVVSTLWKNIGQIGSFPQVGVKIKNV